MAMPPIVFRVKLFRGDFDQAQSQLRLLWLMEALCRINQSHVRQWEALAKRKLVPAPYPPLYRANIHYEPERGTEEWPDIPTILEDTAGTGRYPGRWGDCEDLGCYRIGQIRELPFHHVDPSGRMIVLPEDIAWAKANRKIVHARRVSGGIKAKPFAKWKRKPDGTYGYHALVLLPDGRLEDPSLTLGMGREAFYAKNDIVQAFADGRVPPKILFAQKPDVMVVDPEKRSGYASRVSGGGPDAAWGYDRGGVDGVDENDMRELRRLFDGTSPGAVEHAREAVKGLQDAVGELDKRIGWDPVKGEFADQNEDRMVNRLFGYAADGAS